MQIIREVFSNLSSWGSHPVLIEPGKHGSSLTLSADQLLSKIGEFSQMLGQWGLREGSPVLLFLENSVDFVVVFLALLNVKAVPVPVKPEYRYMELEEIFRNSLPQAVVCERSLKPYVADLCDRTAAESSLFLNPHLKTLRLSISGKNPFPSTTPTGATDTLWVLYCLSSSTYTGPRWCRMNWPVVRETS